MLALFFAPRLGHLYGDPLVWSAQPGTTRTIMSFTNVQKYGPSSLYLLATLGLAILCLAWLEGPAHSSWACGTLVTFGGVPMFFYLMPWATAQIAGILVSALLGKTIAPDFMNDVDFFAMDPLPDMGGPLWVVYACWVLGTLLL